MAAHRFAAVLDPGWLAVWWPWLLVWAVTAVSLVAAVAVTVRHWRKDRAPTTTRLRVVLYLNDQSVMDLYRMHGAALPKKVKLLLTKGHKIGGTLGIFPLGGSVDRNVNNAKLSTYILKTEAITVIRTIIDVLEKTDDIVHVDLSNQEITYSRALAKALAIADDERPAPVRLQDLDTFVSFHGQFQVRRNRQPTRVLTFEALYGDPTDPADSPRVHLTCTESGLRSKTVPDDPFQAHCLGKVANWDPTTRRLIVTPIAIFR